MKSILIYTCIAWKMWPKTWLFEVLLLGNLLLVWSTACLSSLTAKKSLRHRWFSHSGTILLTGWNQWCENAVQTYNIAKGIQPVRQDPQLVLSTAERNKKSKYNQACESYHAYFTPLCITDEGMLGVEFKSFLKRLGDSLVCQMELFNSCHQAVYCCHQSHQSMLERWCTK